MGPDAPEHSGDETLFLKDLTDAASAGVGVLLVTSAPAGEGLATKLEGLRESLSVELAPATTEADRAYDPVGHDVVVIASPGVDACDTLAQLGDDRAGAIPVVVAGKDTGRAAIVDAMNRGADRYVERDESWPTPAFADLLAELADAYGDRTRRLEREREYRTILENLQEAYYRTDADGTLTRMTPSGAELGGWDSTEQALGNNVMAFYPDEADRSIVDALKANGGSVDNYELVVQRKDGELIDVVTSSHFVTDEAGSIVGIEGILRDISQLKETERELRKSKERLSAIYQSSPTAITLSTLEDGEFVQVNDAFAQITGWEPAEVIGRTTEELGIWADSAQRAEIVSELRSEGRVDNRECTFVDREGNEIVGLFSAETVGIGDQQYMLATTLDITERKEREEALQEAKRELEASNERLNQFADMVSHDLRNPINVAMGRLEIVSDDVDSDHLDTAMGAMTRMQSLIDDLLALARQGQPIEEVERVSLSTVTHRCWDVVDTRAATVTVERDLTFLADPTRLRQLFENLLRNAIEHGGDEISLRVGPTPEDDGFYVADDGPGIPESDRETVLESGYTTAEDGTGFGLAIAEEITAAHDWDFDVCESETGGARFEITGVDTV